MEYKHLFTSAVFWGAVVAVIVPLLALFGLKIPEEYLSGLPEKLVGMMEGIFALVGIVLVLLGRKFETKRVYLFKKPLGPPKFAVSSAAGIITLCRIIIWGLEIYIFLRNKGQKAKDIIAWLKKIREKVGGVEFEGDLPDISP